MEGTFGLQKLASRYHNAVRQDRSPTYRHQVLVEITLPTPPDVHPVIFCLSSQVGTMFCSFGCVPPLRKHIVYNFRGCRQYCAIHVWNNTNVTVSKSHATPLARSENHRNSPNKSDHISAPRLMSKNTTTPVSKRLGVPHVRLYDKRETHSTRFRRRAIGVKTLCSQLAFRCSLSIFLTPGNRTSKR